ncbi:heavy-metal-associated domain-containing protein [Acetobacter vaccinii]|uniref:Heavy-metal-associated domain-containing protein n=1 Tax=Acetobacter vaccinii TaxID=2592655 RepID=A0A5C1YRB8_9PROT|nr:heavy metal-associated domain-containing protein [Acetobacter vaccinii]QEO17690.1 heavy-metal-associated domain-containing protein [Acetobacter vaccinii]
MADKATESLSTADFLVEGMTCDGCASAVKRALAAIDGVESTQVNLSKNEVVVTYDPARAGVSSLQNAIRGAGYEVG